MNNMLSNVLDRISFWSLFAVVTLLPIFFLPYLPIPVETSKGLLLVIGLVVSLVSWLAARFSDGKIILPRSALLLAGLGIAFSFLISALFSPAMRVSLFGTMFDPGTFYFMLGAFTLFFMSSILFRDPKNAGAVFWGVLASSSILLLAQALRFFMPEALSFGVLGGKTGNLFGSWNAFGAYNVFIAIVSIFVLEFFILPKRIKWILIAALVLSLLMSVAVNSSLAWMLLGIFSLLIFIYKVSFFYAGKRGGEEEETKIPFPVFSFAAVMVSLLFFMSGQFIGGYLPERLGLSSAEVNPSFEATMSVAKQALPKSPVVGAGPNRFGEAWNLYKPLSVNSGIFWNASFSSGSGMIPTFFITTGILGIISWLAFFYFLISAGIKSVFSGIRRNKSKEMTVFFLMSLYLFTASFLFSSGSAIILLAFAFAGGFAGLAILNKENEKSVTWSFLDNPKKSFFSIAVLVIIMLLSAAAGFKYVERFASIPYFQRVLSASDIGAAESSAAKALTLYSSDLYLRTYAQVQLAKINNIASGESLLSGDGKAELQASFDEAVGGAELAIEYDGTNYLNYSLLGTVYNTAGALGVDGAYQKAIEAYTQAVRLNPQNPGIRLALAQISFASGNIQESRDYGGEALTLKPNYIEALLFLSQLERSAGNISQALSYAEEALSFDNTNTDISGYVNLLRNESLQQ